MPWDIIQDPDNGKFCVYKVGNKEPLHCYDNQGDAERYAAALYAHAHDVHRGIFGDFLKNLKAFFRSPPPVKEPTSTQVMERWVLGTGGKAEVNCPKCIEFAAMQYQPLGFFPQQRAKTTYCKDACTCSMEYNNGRHYDIDRIADWEEWESWYSMTRAQNDLSDDDAAFILAQAAIQPNRTFFIHRTKNNRVRWFAWPACTAFINRDREIDSMALFDRFIDHIERTQEWPYLTFFHQDEKFRMGESDFVARDHVAYLVSGLFDETKIAQEAIKGLMSSEPHYWGTSIRYQPIGKPYYIVDRGKKVPVYSDGIHKEVSLLPEQAASSIFTAFPILQENRSS